MVLAPLERITAKENLDASVVTWVSRCGHSGLHHHGQGDPVHGWPVSGILPGSWRQTHHHHSLLSTANGMMERLHRRLKGALRAHISNWLENQQYAALGIRGASKDVSNISTTKATLGQGLIHSCQAPPGLIPASGQWRCLVADSIRTAKCVYV